MVFYLRHSGFNKQIKDDPPSGSRPGSSPGRGGFSKLFLGFFISFVLLSHPNFLLGHDAPARPRQLAASAASDDRADVFSAIGSKLSFLKHSLEAQGGAAGEGAEAPLKIDAHVSYFNGLLIVFGFVVGVWLTVILMIAVSWRFKTWRQDQPGNYAFAAGQPPAAKNACTFRPGQQADDEALMDKIGLLRDILKGMNDQVETLGQDAPPEDPEAKSARVRGELEGLLSQADRLVDNMEEGVHEAARKEQDCCEADPDCSGANPEQAEMHVRARKLRAEGCRLLAEDQCEEAACRFEKSLAILRELAAASPENQLWGRDLVLACHNLGRALEGSEKYQAALDCFNEALDLARGQVDRNPGSLDWKRGLAASHSHVGRVLSLLGNQEGAWKNFDKEMGIMNYMVNKQPGNKSWQYALASAYHNMGQLLERRGQGREALEVFKKDQAVLKRLVAADPNNTAWLYDLACVHGQMARMYKEQGFLKDALGNARRYLGAMRRLSEREPNNTTYRRELTVALGQVGRLLELRGEYDQALTTFKATLEIRRNLAQLEPDNPVWQDDLLVCLYKMGDVLFAQKDYEEAWRYYQEALKLVDGLIEKDGRQDNWLMGKCGVLLRLGNLHQAHDGGTAANYYQSALNIAEQPHPDDAKEGDWLELTGLIKKNMGQQEQAPATTH